MRSWYSLLGFIFNEGRGDRPSLALCSLANEDMNPKISDFGTARAFRGDQTEENTNRVVRTHGYISPEYMVDGLFSVKSDVYSFGVMVLEILSGKKNREFHHPDH